jgi:hypothetical protein
MLSKYWYQVRSATDKMYQVPCIGCRIGYLVICYLVFVIWPLEFDIWSLVFGLWIL